VTEGRSVERQGLQQAASELSSSRRSDANGLNRNGTHALAVCFWALDDYPRAIAQLRYETSVYFQYFQYFPRFPGFGGQRTL